MVSPWILPSGDRSGEGLPSCALLRARDTGQPSQELSHSISETGLSGDDAAVFSFEGFPNPSPCAESSLSRRRILVLARAAAQSVEISSRGNVFSLHSHSGLSAPDARSPTSSSGVSVSGVAGRACLLGRLLPKGSSVVVRSLSSGSLGRLSSSPTGALSLYRCVRCRVGRVSRLRPPIRLVVSRCFSIFDQPPRTSGSIPCHPGFSPSPPGQVGVSLHRQYVRSVIPLQGRGHSFIDPQRRGSGNTSPLRVQRSASAPPVCPRSPQRLGRLSQTGWPDPRLRVDSPHGCLPGAFPLLAGDGGFVRHLPQPSPPGVLFAHGRSPSGGGRCIDPILGSSSGLCLPSFRPYPEGAFQSSRLPQSGADPCGSLLAAPALVSGPPRSSSGGPSPSASTSGSSPSAPLPSVPPEHPCAGADSFSHCQRSARHFGFSARVARQLAFSRRPSTHLNHQSKWSTYRSWCHSRGHSVSRPSILKIADFLLYLRRSLRLFYSSIASYRSMLSAAFRFVLPELSSHPVLHDLLRSFRIKRPLPTSRFPSWDLLRVLSPLCGSPFEPLESCSRRDLTRKTLFLLSLATARRVGEFQAVSSAVSSSGGDLFLSYLPEFRAKSESASNPLPRSFRVRSLRDFVGSLPNELFLCPVRALPIYLRRTSSLSPHPRSLFVSPRAPSRSLSKNALSFFLCSVIRLSFPSSLSPPPSSSRAHSIRAVSTSAAFSRSVPLASILAAATWSSSTVFTSFNLRDIQFSSSSGFSLGPVVAADAVI